MRYHLAALALPAIAGCLPAALPPEAPVAEEAAPAEHLVLSDIQLVSLVTEQDAPVRSAAQRDPVFFRLGAGYGAVGQIDLSPCRDRGLDPGYVHMHVTFSGAGGIARAAVESVTQPTPEALTCIGELLQALSVPAFEGGDVTLSKSVFVESASGASEGSGQEILVKGKRAAAEGRKLSFAR